MDLHTERQMAALQRISRDTDAREVALAAYGRLVALLERLEPADWERPTECDGWDVAAMVGHVIGAGTAGASLRENLRQLWHGKRHAARFDGNSLDATNELQVRDHADLGPQERIAALREVAPAAVDGRLGLPRVLRRLPIPLDAGGSTASGMPTRLLLGEVMEVAYTRDVWLHTIDIARATSVPYQPDPHVDGRIVEDVVAEWARRHGQPVGLVLEGPAGGRFRQGVGGVDLRLDAIEFCRILSGRAEPPIEGVDGKAAAGQRLLTTRLVF
ncbi:MAG: maleylpyruvate isomerase family mycothiol-dependent enzyme [Nitriliruptoraceae bacterium]